jgi:hypothetical protein
MIPVAIRRARTIGGKVIPEFTRSTLSLHPLAERSSPEFPL